MGYNLCGARPSRVKAVWPNWALLSREKTGGPPPPPFPTDARLVGRIVGEGPDLGHRQRRGSPWRARGDEAGRLWGTGDGRPEKRWRAPAWGSWSGSELERRLLQW
jgi:hypothetical protein